MKVKNLLLAALLGVGVVVSAHADPITVGLHASSAGLDGSGMTLSSSGLDVMIGGLVMEDSTAGVLAFDGLRHNRNYSLVMEVANNTGSDWSAFSLEILEPSGDFEDRKDPVQPSYVPASFSTSTKDDGFSFAQGAGVPRSASAFGDVFADEISNARDLLSFSNGLVNGMPFGQLLVLTFGLRDFHGNRPFLVRLVPVATADAAIPEPASLLLVGTGLVAVGNSLRRRRRRQSNA